MSTEKDIRFTEKKVDEGWKDSASREKTNVSGASAAAPKSDSGQSSSKTAKTSKGFVNLVTSLGLQAMIHLGEVPNPETQIQEVNTQAAREVIDLLVMIQEKTQGNLSSEENQLIQSLVPELQMKFAQKI